MRAGKSNATLAAHPMAAVPVAIGSVSWISLWVF